MRFRNLLELANSSKFEGERANALAAAERLATKHGLSLDEAARWSPEQAPQQPKYGRAHTGRMSPFDLRANSNVAADTKSHEEDKARWQEAVQTAKTRGLDQEKGRSNRQESRPRSSSKSRRNPLTHAEVLLKETSLPCLEIVDITGLDIYTIVGMKLKLRKAA